MITTKERRQPILCPNCKKEMVCMNKFDSIYKLTRGVYIWYVCPRRNGEHGCGHSTMFEVSPKTKRPKRIVVSAKFKRAVVKSKHG